MKLKYQNTDVWNSDAEASEELEERFVPVVEDMMGGSITPNTFPERNLVEADAQVITAVNQRFVELIESYRATIKHFGSFSKFLADSTTKLPIDVSTGKCKPILDAITTTNIGVIESKYRDVMLLNKQFVEFFKGISDSMIFFEDNYHHAHWKGPVVRYGINAGAIKSEEFEVFNASAQHPSTSSPAPSSSVQSQKASSAGKQASSTSKSQKEAPKALDLGTESIFLHPAEVYVIEKAIMQLQRDESSSSVIVDIFVRAKDKTIDLSKKPSEMTHSIVLFKNTTQISSTEASATTSTSSVMQVEPAKIFVIDPSNSKSSGHLGQLHYYEIFNGCRLVTVDKPMEVYKGGEAGGVRDCVDIAVKIASGMQYVHQITKESIPDLPVLYELTNQDTVNKHLISDDIRLSSKIRQTSDPVVRKRIDNGLKIVSDRYEKLKLFQDKEAPMLFLKECSDILISTQDPREYDDISMKFIGKLFEFGDGA